LRLHGVHVIHERRGRNQAANIYGRRKTQYDQEGVAAKVRAGVLAGAA